MKNAAVAGDFASRRQRAFVAQPARGLDQRGRIDVEHRLGVGLVAGFRIVAGEEEEVADAERGGAHHLALQRDAVLVAAGDLQDRLDLHADEDGGGRKRRHMGAGAGAVGDVDRVGEPLQRRRLAAQVLRVGRHRRGDFRGHDEPAGPHPLFERAQAGACLVVHRHVSVGSAAERERIYALPAHCNCAVPGQESPVPLESCGK